MLVCTNEIPEDKLKRYKEQLAIALENPQIKTRISPMANLESFCSTWEMNVSPIYGINSFFSVDGDELLGVLQYHILKYDTGYVHCTDTLGYNLGSIDMVFGRDYKQFYAMLNTTVHKVNMTIDATFTEEEYNKAYGKPFEGLLRHLAEYNPRYVGKFEKHSQNALGELVDVHLVEFITQKGRNDYNEKGSL